MLSYSCGPVIPLLEKTIDEVFLHTVNRDSWNGMMASGRDVPTAVP
jgi:hypothetical protein